MLCPRCGGRGTVTYPELYVKDVTLPNGEMITVYWSDDLECYVTAPEGS